MRRLSRRGQLGYRHRAQQPRDGHDHPRDDLGNRTSQRNRTDPIPTYSVVWTYDPSGRMLTRVADAVTATYTYDYNGNQLTASASGMTISSTYDRLNRVIAVDDEDAGTTADTTYTYSLTSPTWSDPTGAYAATLDKFDRATVVNDPASPTDFTFTYGTTGEVLASTQGNANTVAQTFDAAGHLLTRTTTDGGVSRAAYAYTYNRAGQVLSEASTVTGDPANGTVTYGYDPLGQLTGSTLAGTTTAYGWDTVTNRTSVTVGTGTPATTAYDAANRPTSGANPSAAYASDADGRLTARPGQTTTWDHLGRLTAVKDASGTTTIASYSYDPLDRLRTAQATDGSRIRFRYVGLTTSAAQRWDDVAGTVSRCIGNGWMGERLLDWTGVNSNLRTYGENAHHDVTWLADSSGAVSQSLRYDPWGTPRSAVPAGYTPFRFQGSWHDGTVDLAWVVTRWYAPALGRFVSEDTLLGEPREPDSRHLYAYGAGEPVGRWDAMGSHWYSVKAGDSLIELAKRFYRNGNLNWRIRQGNPGGRITTHNLNRNFASIEKLVGECIWIPFTQIAHECGTRRDSIEPAAKLWGARFDRVITYVANMMRQRSFNEVDGLGTVGPWVPGNFNIWIRWAQLVRENGPWDIKHDIERKWGDKRLFWMAVRDDPAPESFRVDLLGLIHYGYLGRAHGIGAVDLRVGNRFFGGIQGDDDNFALELGMDMWRTFGHNMNYENLRQSLLQTLRQFRPLGDALKPPLHS